MATEPVIKYDIAGTINLGNFENVKIGFGLEAPRRDGESMDDALARIVQFVDENWARRAEAAVANFRDATE